MMGLLILEILTLVSMFASLMSLLFNPGSFYLVMSLSGYYFIITLVVYLVSEKKPLGKWGYVALGLPILYLGISPFNVILPSIILYYMLKEKDFGFLDHRYYIKTIYGVIIAVYLVMEVLQSFFPEIFQARIENYWQVVFFFFLSSVQYMRVLRFTEVKMQSAYIRKQNIRFSLISGFVYFMVVAETYRNTLMEWIQNFTSAILAILFKPIYWIGNFLNFKSDIVEDIDISRSDEMTDQTMDYVDKIINSSGNEKVVNFLKGVIEVCLTALIICLIIFVIYMMIRGLKRQTKQVISEQLTVERTILLKKKEKNKKKRRWFISRSSKEEIRHLYLKHMERLDVVDDIGCTTQRVYQVGLETEVANPLNVREIYREVRYNPNALESDAKSQLDTFKRALK